MAKKKVGIGIGVLVGIIILAGLIYLSIVKKPMQEEDVSKNENSPTTDEVFDPPEDPDAQQVTFSDDRVNRLMSWRVS